MQNPRTIALIAQLQAFGFQTAYTASTEPTLEDDEICIVNTPVHIQVNEFHDTALVVVETPDSKFWFGAEHFLSTDTDNIVEEVICKTKR